MCVLFYHRGVWVCGRDGSTPLYRVCFSGIANTQALLTYLNFNMTDLYYSRISRCRPPPSPLFKFSIPWGRDFALLFRVYYPSLICEPVFFSFFSWKLPFFSDLFTCCQGISRFSQFVSVFSTFELFVPLNRNSKKNLHALEVLCLRRRHPPEARSDVTRCPVETERQARTRQNALVLDNDLLHFSWASDHYIGRRGLSPDIFFSNLRVFIKE